MSDDLEACIVAGCPNEAYPAHDVCAMCECPTCHGTADMTVDGRCFDCEAPLPWRDAIATIVRLRAALAAERELGKAREAYMAGQRIGRMSERTLVRLKKARAAAAALTALTTEDQ